MASPTAVDVSTHHPDEDKDKPRSTVSTESYRYDGNKIDDDGGDDKIDDDGDNKIDDDGDSSATECYYNNGDDKIDDDGNSSATECYYNNGDDKIDGDDDDVSSDEHPCNLTPSLPYTWPKNARKKRVAVVSETGNDEISQRVEDELAIQFFFLEQVRKGSDFHNVEIKSLLSIKEILVKQSCTFLQSIGINIDETNLLKIFEGRRQLVEFDIMDQRVQQTEEGDETAMSKISGETILDKRTSIEDINATDVVNNSSLDSDEAITLSDHKLENMPELMGSKGAYECKECKKVYHDFRALGEHMASHNRKNMPEFKDTSNYFCYICEEAFDDFRALGGHIASHNRKKRASDVAFAGGKLGAEIEKSYECNICLRKISTGQALGGHESCHKNIADNIRIEDSSTQDPVSALDLNATPDERVWDV